MVLFLVSKPGARETWRGLYCIIFCLLQETQGLQRQAYENLLGVAPLSVDATHTRNGAGVFALEWLPASSPRLGPDVQRHERLGHNREENVVSWVSCSCTTAALFPNVTIFQARIYLEMSALVCRCLGYSFWEFVQINICQVILLKTGSRAGVDQLLLGQTIQPRVSWRMHTLISRSRRLCRLIETVCCTYYVCHQLHQLLWIQMLQNKYKINMSVQGKFVNVC